MGARFPGAVSKAQNAPAGSGGEVVACIIGSVSGALDGQPIMLLWSVEYIDGVAPIIPGIVIRRGSTIAGIAVYTSGLFPIGVNGVSRLLSGVTVDIVSAGVASPYIIGFNNSNNGTSVNFANITLCAFAL